jgi:isoleucyl-tRNA synthetase
MSSFYLDAIKDRMYCDGKDWPTRRSGQKACHEVLVRLTKLIYPILMHTAEETYERIPATKRMQSIHLESLSIEIDGFSTERFADLLDREQRFDMMLDFRKKIATAIEEWKSGAGIKDTQDVSVELHGTDADVKTLQSFGSDIAVYFRVASIELHEGVPRIELSKSTFEKCERSRVRRADVEQTQWNGSTVPLSARDRRALGIG